MSVGAGIASGASTGAGIGSFFGPVGTLAGGALGGALGGFLGRGGSETPTQRTQRELIDQLLASLGGQGPFSGLFNFDEEEFQRNFADPARAQFRNVTTPQIQQGFIASGQQRGTGLEDTLTRAGVDMDQLLNQFRMQQQQGAQQRQLGAITGILGQPAGVQGPIGAGEAIQQGIGGFLTSPEFGEGVGGLSKNIGQLIAERNARKGFESNQDLQRGLV